MIEMCKTEKRAHTDWFIFHSACFATAVFFKDFRLLCAGWSLIFSPNVGICLINRLAGSRCGCLLEMQKHRETERGVEPCICCFLFCKLIWFRVELCYRNSMKSDRCCESMNRDCDRLEVSTFPELNTCLKRAQLAYLTCELNNVKISLCWSLYGVW